MQNFKIRFLLSALGAWLGVAQAVSALAGIGPVSLCPDCGPKGLSGAQAVQLESQIPSGFLAFPTVQQKSAAELSQWVNYTGDQLPNAFERPWSLSAAQIDTYRWVYDQTRGSYSRELAPFTPNFTTRYYDHNKGFLWNSEDAPWNVVSRFWNIHPNPLPLNLLPLNLFEASPPRVPTPGSSLWI
ncbi:MAG: hypothetical protein ACK5QT_11615 [Oligoflexia bacterium]|jgi:hypothetical protein